MALTPYQKKYHAIKNALTSAEKDLIKYYEMQWALRSRVPSVEEVTAYLRNKRPNLRQTSVNYYLTRYPVRKALKERGIPFEQHTRDELTDQQQNAALTVMNMMDTRPVAEKLDALGILPATYYAWLNDPVFKNFLLAQAEQNKINVRPAAITEFTKKIHQGEWNAIKFWLETTGEFNNSDTPQSEILIRMIVEIVQKHVKDPATIMAIAQDIKLASANRTLEVAAITSTATEDPELEEAKKMIGFG